MNARLTTVAIAALVVGTGVALAAQREGPGRALGRPADNGLIAYSYAGDIYLGDPVTGDTRRIVGNAAYEVDPIFAPDGQRISFIRGDPQTPKAKLVVVGTDGSQERSIFPRGRRHRGIGSYGWTPNGDSLVVELDRAPFTFPHGDGELSLFDSSGRREERVLTPPLPRKPGAHYWGHNQVAPMLRPPSGDRILSGDWNDVRMFDRRLTSASPVDDALETYEPYYPYHPTWSPDGTQILIDLALYTGRLPGARTKEGGGLFVMSSAGRRLRRLATGGSFSQWSPDGSKIAFERVREATDRAVIVVVDLGSGTKRTLESTLALGKEAGAKFPTITYNNVAHHWYYEGWTWAPDGRSLLVLENLRTRPWVVDIETDTVTKLPWLADSMPSWQRVTGS